MLKTTKNLILATLLSVALALSLTGTAYADDNECEPNYGGGETCIINKSFSIEKEVRIYGSDDEFKDKITGVEADEIVEFRIVIKNTTIVPSGIDEDDIPDFDNMKMKDILPDELERVGGAGLTEYWDDFAPGEEIEFKIRAQIDSDEFDRDEDFEKCVVNEARVYYDDDLEGSDTATVCYGNVDEVTELPETGYTSTLSILGLGLMSLGVLIRRLA